MYRVSLLVFCTLGGIFFSGLSLADTSKNRMEGNHASSLVNSDLSSRRRVRRTRADLHPRIVDDEKVLYRTVYKCEAMASTYQFDVPVPPIAFIENLSWFEVSAYRWSTSP